MRSKFDIRLALVGALLGAVGAVLGGRDWPDIVTLGAVAFLLAGAAPVVLGRIWLHVTVLVVAVALIAWLLVRQLSGAG